ncbi:hypothetical protein XI09_15055 [Bradyrhizobium sp. CCBAU 11386]|uniref:hypothetical protein n=1 Tax=Bradyrhizobium sp. CCBAU 11386 TaxID=1630837 RepID=UPI0023033E9F|nr:hypothetical protein [Bradyrhizobium sp. CCBAU 11386]MDA9505926.1 hypothetical protein [Bradyrhizobium sp. CCBAU 11386]
MTGARQAAVTSQRIMPQLTQLSRIAIFSNTGAAMEMGPKAISAFLRIRKNSLGQLLVSQAVYPDRLSILDFIGDKI